MTTQKFDVYGLQHLPPTAMIIPERGDAPIIVDANPGILTLPTATLQTVADATALTEQALATWAQTRSWPTSARPRSGSTGGGPQGEGAHYAAARKPDSAAQPDISRLRTVQECVPAVFRTYEIKSDPRCDDGLSPRQGNRLELPPVAKALCISSIERCGDQ